GMLMTPFVLHAKPVPPKGDSTDKDDVNVDENQMDANVVRYYMTLYDDGKDFEQDSALVNFLVKLLEFDLYVCVVTAAGYPGDAQRYEQRLSGVRILQKFLGSTPAETLHFLSTGNDFATRSQCCTLWIVNPEETQNVLIELVSSLEEKEKSQEN
ncbi:7332_t:CDS:2, partial [Racocetra fulgida]